MPSSMLWLAGVERRLERDGLVPVDSPTVELDDDGSLLTAGMGWDGTLVSSPTPVIGWLLTPAGQTSPRLDPDRASARVAAAAQRIDDSSGVTAQAALELVTTVSPTIDWIAPGASASEVVNAIGATCRAGRGGEIR